MTEQALGMTANRAMTGSPLVKAAQGNLQSTINGDFLDPSSNPWLSKTFDMAAGKVRAGLDSQFNSGGTYGGSLHQGAMAENLGDLATKIYGGNYADERNRQMQSMMFAPTMAAQDYVDAGQLANVGGAYEGQAKNYLDDAMARFNFYQGEPFNRLQQFSSLINPIAGQGSTTQQTSKGPSTTDSLGQTIGGLGTFAAGMAQLWPVMFGSDPEMKTNIEPVDDDKLLERVRGVRASTYEYKPELGMSFAGPRIGPMADDFAKSFGGDGHVLPLPRLLGVLWATNHALARKFDALERKVA